MKPSATLISSRLMWCRIQRTRASTKEEADRLLAEEEGLLDAMLGMDRTAQFSQNQPSVLKSYEEGLHDGNVLLELQQWIDARHSTFHNAGTGEGKLSP